MRINLGCGKSPKPGYVNIDGRALPGVDIVRDVLRGLPFSDGTVDEIYSENFLEHLPQVEVIWFFNEMHRVLKSGGFSHHLIPEAGTTIFNQDPTHTAHFVFETFTYFRKDHHRNLYYGEDAISPWIIDALFYTEPNKLIDVVMRKP